MTVGPLLAAAAISRLWTSAIAQDGDEDFKSLDLRLKVGVAERDEPLLRQALTEVLGWAEDQQHDSRALEDGAKEYDELVDVLRGTLHPERTAGVTEPPNEEPT